MASVLISCPSCFCEKIYRHGQSRNGEQRYRCRECGHCFQLDYRYEANKPGVTDKIIEMAMKGSGVRDTSRVLGISISMMTTVIAHLKNARHPQSHRFSLKK